MNNLVSVIIPTFNYGHLIAETVQSAQNQTYSNLEIIIVDDCSTDNTQAKVEALAADDRRIKYIKKEKNAGVSAARNTGLSLAQGVFIAFLDGDDLWEKNKITTQLDFFSKNPSLGFTNCGGILFGSHEEPFTGSHHRHKKIKRLHIDLLYHAAIPCPMSCLIFRHDVLNNTGGFDPQLSYAEDRDLLMRALQHANFLPLDDQLVRIRKHTGNYAHKFFEKAVHGNIRFVKRTFRYLSWTEKYHWFKVLGELYYAASYQYLHAGYKTQAWTHHITALVYNPLLLFTLKFHVQTVKCIMDQTKNAVKS